MWVVRLTDKQLEVLRALLRSEEHLGPALKGSIEALDLARWDELPEAELPWEEIERSPAARASPRPTSSGTSPARAAANDRAAQGRGERACSARERPSDAEVAFTV